MAKIAFFEIEDWEEKYLKAKLSEHELFFYPEKLTSENLEKTKNIDIISIFIYSEITKKIVKKLEGVKAIVTNSTGFDHIDLKACKRKKIKVFNVPFYGENTVAEQAFGLILSLSRKIPEAIERVKEGNFCLDGLRGFDLKGKTLGIIGMGEIGEHMARIAKSFQMKVLAFDIKKHPKLARNVGFKYTTFEKLLEESDIVTLHCIYNKKTHHLLNSKTLKLMKQGSYIVNTARGGLIDNNALIKEIRAKRIAGAALDVLEDEDLIKEEIQLISKNCPKDEIQNTLENHVLLKLDNVLVTPHNAFNTKEALQRILKTTLQNIQDALSKKKTKNQVI